jgi:hypothetical protein
VIRLRCARAHIGERVMPESDDAKEYRRCAQECVKIANTMSHSAHRVALLEMAQAWMKLAEKAGNKPTGVIYEAPPAESPRPDC